MKSKMFRRNPAPTGKFAEDLNIVADLKMKKEICEVLAKSAGE